MKLCLSTLFSEVGIETFTLSVTELPYPAITICKKNGLYDPGEYLRAVFNQFKYAYRKDDEGSCDETALLRSHYRNFVSPCNREPKEIPEYVKARLEDGKALDIVWIESLLYYLHIWTGSFPESAYVYILFLNSGFAVE